MNGNITVNGATVSGSGADYDLVAQTKTSATIGGSVSSKSTLRLTTNGTTFNGTYRASYEQPASLANLAGSYRGVDVSGTSTTQQILLTISSTGAVSAGSEALGCALSGSASPRAGGKNVFDLEVTFIGVDCAIGNNVRTVGIIVVDNTVNAARLHALTLNSEKSNGFVYTGTKDNALLINNVTGTSSLAIADTGRYRCSSISKAEATALYVQGHTYLDRDHDGKPCEANDITVENTIYNLPPPTTTPSSGKCYVNGYYRSNGTYVQGYYRSC